MPLPSGTVALLFTDVEGSMELARTLGDGYGAVLADHRTLVREAVGRFGGREIDCRADEFFVVFERTADAVSAAAELQRSLAAHAWPDGGELRVRAAVHAGEPILAEDEYVGIDVHRVARICAAGHGGQVLLSQAAHGLVRDADPSWSFAELGEVELVGLPR